MNNIDLNLGSIRNLSQLQQTKRTERQYGNAGTQDNTVEENGKSIFDTLLESVNADKTNDHEKFMQEIQTIPVSAAQRLFSDDEIRSAGQTDSIFEDLRIRPTDEIGTLLESLKATSGEKAAGTAEAPGKTDEPQENYLQKFFKSSLENLPPKSDKLEKNSESIAEAAERVKEAARKDELTGARDMDRLRSAAKEFVGQYNSLSETAKHAGSNTVDNKSRFISEMTDAYSSRLQKVGITRDENGDLKLDEKKFAQADDKELEKVFGKEDSFADFIYGQAKQLAAYAQSDLYKNAGAYTDAGTITQISNISGSYFNMLG